DDLKRHDAHEHDVAPDRSITNHLTWETVANTARRASKLDGAPRACYTSRAGHYEGGRYGGDGEDGGIPWGRKAVRDPRVPGAGSGAGGGAHQGRARERVWLRPALLAGGAGLREDGPTAAAQHGPRAPGTGGEARVGGHHRLR